MARPTSLARRRAAEKQGPLIGTGAGVVNLVAITWHRNEPPHSHISTEDKILALGAIRTMEHVLVRDWLDGRVTT